MTELRLMLRTPHELLVDRVVEAVTAEDLDGWFGIAPGRAALVAVLPPGLLLFRDDEGEAFVAIAGGLLDLRGSECRVMARDAVVARDLDTVADEVERQLDKRRERALVQAGVMGDLVQEATQRMVREARR